MPSITENLRSQRDALGSEVAQYRSLLDSIGSREATADERETLDRLDASLSKREADIARFERGVDLERRSTQPEDEPNVARTTATDVEYRQAFNQFLRSGDTSGLEFRALQTTGDAEGGFLVPDEFRNTLVEAIKTYGGVRPVATTITTSTGADLLWPTADTTGQMGEIVDEGDDTGEEDVDFGQAKLGAYLYSSKKVAVSLQLLQDNAFGLEAWLRDKLAERIARIQNVHWTTGNGTTQPEGLLTNAQTGVTAASPIAVTGDELISLQYELDPGYWPNARYMLNGRTLAGVRKLKDTTGQYIWQPGLQAGIPSSLLGFPIQINNEMPVATDSPTPGGAATALFGDFARAYVIRDVAQFTMIRDPYTRSGKFQVVFLGFLRSDAVVQDAAAYAALVQHT